MGSDYIQTLRARTGIMSVRVTTRKSRYVIRHLPYTRRMFNKCKVIHRSRRDIDS